MRMLCNVLWITLTIVVPTSGVSQLLAPRPTEKLELRLQPEAVLKSIPQAFTVILVNGTANDVRVPVPSVECGDAPHGTIWLRLDFKSSGDRAGLSRSCVKDFVYSSISERINQWRVMRPGESMVLARINDRALGPGSYDYWASYDPPATSEADQDWLRKAGIDYPKEKLDSPHVKFVNR